MQGLKGTQHRPRLGRDHWGPCGERDDASRDHRGVGQTATCRGSLTEPRDTSKQGRVGLRRSRTAALPAQAASGATASTEAGMA